MSSSLHQTDKVRTEILSKGTHNEKMLKGFANLLTLLTYMHTPLAHLP